MKLDGSYEFEAPREEVFKALLDPEVLASVLPGCDKLELVDGVYNGVLKVKVGPVQGKFNGKVELKDIKDNEGYRMAVDGKGQQGFVKADAGVVLTDADGGTHIEYDADAKVGGKIASVGQRLIDASAKAIIKQSLENLHETVKARAAHTASVNAAAEQAEAAAQAAAEAKAAGDAAAAEDAARRAAEAEAAKAAAEAAEPELKQASQAELAAAVAREVSNELIPVPVRYGLVAAAAAAVLYGVYAFMG